MVAASCAHEFIQTFITPMMTSGLETVTLNKRRVAETYNSGTLNRLECIPGRTANKAVYQLSDIQPIKAILDMDSAGRFHKA